MGIREGIVQRVVVVLGGSAICNSGESLTSTGTSFGACKVLEASDLALGRTNSDGGNHGHEEGSKKFHHFSGGKMKELDVSLLVNV